MGIKDRITRDRANGNVETATPQYQARGADEFWREFSGLEQTAMESLTKPQRSALWKAVSSTKWVCLAASIVGMFEHVPDADQDNLDAIIARNMRTNGNMDGRPVRPWNMDYPAQGAGIWVMLDDGSVIHWQASQDGLIMSAWLRQCWSGGVQVSMKDAICRVLIPGMRLTSMQDAITEALEAIEWDQAALSQVES